MKQKYREIYYRGEKRMKLEKQYRNTSEFQK